MTKEEKAVIKEENEKLTQKFGFCIMDGWKLKIKNFKIQARYISEGLFISKDEEHPNIGKLKRRIEPEDVIINIGKEAEVPEPPPGHKWKEVRYDNKVSWLACWSDNILKSNKYITLHPSSKLQQERDLEKFETARKLKVLAPEIREKYTRDFDSDEIKVRQRAVAFYFYDKLALRAGSENARNTVECCSLRVEHIQLEEEKNGHKYVISFNFLSKDYIRYVNSVPVDEKVYENLNLFMEDKQPGEKLFDQIKTSDLNKYLRGLMEGLSVKVFRTYRASETMQEKLDLLTKKEMSLTEKILAYNRANRDVAILCNHKKAISKNFEKNMEKLKTEIEKVKEEIKKEKRELKAMKADKSYEKKTELVKLEGKLKKLEIQADNEENKEISLKNSILYYIDPRICVAWCKKWEVPIKEIFTPTQRDIFKWAIKMAGPDFTF